MTLDKFIEIRCGRIEDIPTEFEVDTIVNAASPDLMGGTGDSVDKAIHRAIDNLNYRGFLKEQMKDELKDNPRIVKCKRGQVVKTKGYNLCQTLIHTVGPEEDKDYHWPNVCSSSRINLLKLCYRNITKMIFEDDSIEKVAIPVISSGNYGFDFELAFKVGIAEVYNTLLELKQKDPEMFAYTTLEKIYFVIMKQEYYEKAKEILGQYKKTFKQEKRVVARTAWQSQRELLKEVQLYDAKRGHFSVVKMLRKMLIVIRMLSIYNYLKDWIAKENWELRRQVVEIITLLKMVFPIISLMFLQSYSSNIFLKTGIVVFMTYNLVDTVTYLMSLIVLADIQNPSANVIRSLLMVLMNYIEVALEMAVISHIWMTNRIKIAQMVAYCLMGIDTDACIENITNIWFLGMNSCIKFFFVTLAWGYFANHLRQRKFRTNENEVT